MLITDEGVPAEDLITAVKNSVRRADISAVSEHSDLRVSAVQLILRVVSTATLGGGVDFRIPFIGMRLKVGAKVTRQNTHTLDITLAPPDLAGPELRDGDIETTLVDAITSIQAIVASAAQGDDPWVLKDGTVDITFVVTENGSISLGLDADLTNELTNTLRLSLTAVSP